VLRPLARWILRPILKYALDTHLVVGNAGILIVGERVALANAVLNLSSGSITLGDRTILSHGVMLVTGRHDFLDGKRASLPPERDDGSWGGGTIEVPAFGYDITIGEGVCVGVGAIVLGGVVVGSHCIIAAGAVVTKNFPDHSVIAGIPARRIGDTRDRRPKQPTHP
jgi:acetyltransferase-like isoleucine patch superfamily enzyme